MQITEIYRSLQGESSYAGLPCIFIRLTGCNLRCVWCDSEYTFAGGRRSTAEEVIAQVEKLSGNRDNTNAAGDLVEITGGEPMLQEREVVPLMERLLEKGYRVLLETSGERPLERVPSEVVKVVDVKCPASGEGTGFRLENLQTLTARDELKFVLADRDDYEFARDFLREHRLAAGRASIIFSPAFSKNAQRTRDSANCLLDPRQLAEWIIEDRLRVRLGLQIHKFIWDPGQKGV